MSIDQLITPKKIGAKWREYPILVGKKTIDNLIIKKAINCIDDPFKPESDCLMIDTEELTIYLEYSNLTKIDINELCNNLQGRKIKVTGSLYLNHDALKPAIYTNRIKIYGTN